MKKGVAYAILILPKQYNHTLLFSPGRHSFPGPVLTGVMALRRT
nr:MAG TPA: hypothetical protein [Caudoviricetes sp.]